MIKKWEQRAVHMNFKKAVGIFLITGFILLIAASGAMYGNFHNRIANWEQTKEMDGKYGKKEQDFGENNKSDSDNKEHKGDLGERREKDLEEIYERFPFTWSDLALLAGCAIIGVTLGIWYWLLIMIWACRKAYRIGINTGLAVPAALFFNLAAVVVLYLYAMWKGTCAGCGRVRSGNGKFCSRCGNPFRKECPHCKQEMNILSVYCSNCREKLEENKTK